MLEHVIEDCQCKGKQCTKCKTVKCVGAYRRNGTRMRKECRNCSCLTQKQCYQKKADYYKTQAKKYASSHVEEVKANNKKYRQEHLEQIKEDKKAYYQENSQHIIERSKAYYCQHSEIAKARVSTYYYANPDRVVERMKTWIASNPERYRVGCVVRAARRRTRKTQAGGSYTPKQWADLKEQYDFSCLKCGRKEPDIKLTADHVIPVSRQGSSNIENIQPLCKACNSIKRMKIIDFRQSWQIERKA